MSEQQFDIIFRGDIVFGQPLADVKLRLAQLFKADAAKIDSLFSGRPVPLKRGLDLASAQKYRDALLKAGAQVDLVAVGGVEPVSAPLSTNIAASQSAKTSIPVTALVSTPASAPVAASWTLAPVGSSLLQAAEKPEVVPLQVDTSAYTLRPEGGYLLDPSEQQQVVSAQVHAPDYEVAEVGADLVRADEKLELPLVEVDFGDWDIAELGEDLLPADEKPVVPTPVIVALEASLAPVGADLGQIRPHIIPVIPDVSGIRLAE